MKFTKKPRTNVYGTEYQGSSALTETSTTSTSVWSNKVTITTSDLPLGTYRVDYSFNWRCAAANREADFRIQRNATLIRTWNPSYIRTAGVMSDGGFVTFDSISGVQTITLDFKVSATATTTFIKNAYLVIKRVS